MTTITEVSQTMQTLLTTTANTLAVQTGFIQRQRQVTGAGFAQTLVLGGLAQPQATRKQQQQVAAQLGLTVSPQGLEQRFTPAARDFMRQLLEAGLAQLVSRQPGSELLPPFKGVYLTDCTRLEWAEAGVKLAVRWELQNGQLQASLSELQQHDQKAAIVEAALPAGSLHLGDLGFFNLKRFQRWNEQQVWWLSRFKIGTRLYSQAGQALDLAALLDTTSDWLVLPVQVGVNVRLSAYLLAVATPPEAAAKRQARQQAEARREQRQVSQRQTDLAQWTIYLSNIPTLTVEQAHVLARTRWQIELLFKLWKSEGKVLLSRSADPIRQQCEGYAKLLGVMIAHWLLLVAGWQPQRLGLLDAFRLLRSHVPLLLRVLRQPLLWSWLFDWLQADLRAAAPRSRRRKVPLTFQLWQDFDLVLP